MEVSPQIKARKIRANNQCQQRRSFMQFLSLESEELELSPGDLQKMKDNHRHWSTESIKHQDTYASSWKDINMIHLEIKALCNWIDQNDHILDVGCNNGFTSFEILKKKHVNIHGIDYCERAIGYANKRKNITKNDQISFAYGNILNLRIKSNSYDKVMGIRAIINLPSFEMQKKAILEIHRVLKPQGLYLMSEAFSGSLHDLNAIRKIANLPPLSEPEFNLYLKEPDLEAFLTPYFKIKKIDRFSSLYYLGSRFIREMTESKGESYENEINDFFVNLKASNRQSDFGVQKLYILEKK